jgi:hypothetical protein
MVVSASPPGQSAAVWRQRCAACHTVLAGSSAFVAAGLDSVLQAPVPCHLSSTTPVPAHLQYINCVLAEFGTVNRGTWVYHKQKIPVAIKVLKDKSPEQKHEFRTEADTMSGLDHK